MRVKRKLFCLLGLLLLLLTCMPFFAAAQEEEEEIRVKGISLDQEAIILALGETEVVTATVYPANATDKEIYWEIEDPLVAAVYDLEGSAEVNALAPGTVLLTATTRDGGFWDSCLITTIVLVQTLSLEPAEITLPPGEEFHFEFIIEPPDATEQGVEWESTDPAVASVDEEGTVKALKEGTARIIVRSVQDETIAAYANVTVAPAAAAVPEPKETVTGPIRAEPISKKIDIQWLLIGGLAAVLLAAALAAILLTRKKGKAAPQPQPQPQPQSQPRPLLRGLTGYFAGQTMELTGEELVIGRDPARAQFVYAPEYEAISRKHCALRFDRHTAQFILEDFSSTGTFLGTGEKLLPGSPLRIAPGSRFYLSDPGELFTVELS